MNVTQLKHNLFYINAKRQYYLHQPFNTHKKIKVVWIMSNAL